MDPILVALEEAAAEAEDDMVRAIMMGMQSIVLEGTREESIYRQGIWEGLKQAVKIYQERSTQ